MRQLNISKNIRMTWHLSKMGGRNSDRKWSGNGSRGQYAGGFAPGQPMLE